ncbi:MAG TPA: Bcr/CflA family efflux MFS transporter [Phycisphaerales bacterium]|nr:Bcr/CflA family efflux MFS transporter [Phycisphaerales bacterium]
MRHSDMTESQKTILKLLILFGVPLSGAGIDIFIPSLPSMSTALGVTKSAVSLTIPIYLLAYGLAQPVFGTLADSFGRRLPLIFGTGLFVLGSLIASGADTLEILLFARVLQGIGVSGPAVLTKASLTDAFEGEERMRMANTMTIAWSVGPVMSPVLGGYLQEYYGWNSNFQFLTLYSSLLFLAVLFWWPETAPDRVPLRPKAVLTSYRRVLFHREFYLSVALLGLLYSVMIVFNVLGPFLIQKGLGFTPSEFGRVVLWLGLAWFLGNLSNKRWVRSFPRAQIIRTGLISMLSLAFLMLGIALVTPLGFWSLIIPTFLLFIIGGTVFPNIWGRVLSIFPDAAGTASALMGSLMILGVSVVSAAAGFLSADTAVHLSLTYVFLLATALSTFLKLDRS